MGDRDLRFTKTHEWISVEGDVATIGITDYAQKELGDIVFVELPEEGATFSAGDVLTTVESVKSVSEIYSPVSGETVEVNGELDGSPGLVNTDAHGGGWIVRIKMSDASELAGLMSPEQYEEHTKG